MKKNLIYALLIVILLIGGAMRFYRVNWDSFSAFHPDERNISWAVTRINFFSQLNPKFFAYGGLPIYLYRALGEAVVKITNDPEWLMGWGHIAVIGRYVSATLSTISIVLMFLVARSYFSPAVGIISAFFLAFSPWAVREAHFATTETMLVFFILLLLYFSARNTNFHTIVILGLVWGLALAAKTTSLVFGVIPLFAIWFPQPLKNFRKKFLFTLLLFTIALCFFFLFSPYTILDITHFRESMTYETGVALGRFSVPYTLQFLHTTPYVYHIQTMLWLAGPIVPLGFIGLLVMIFFIVKKRFPMNYVLFTIFPIVYFGWSGSWYAKFARYNVPFLPFVTIAAAWLMVRVFQKLPKNRLYSFIRLFVYSIICLSTVGWGLANFSVFLRPQTRMEASKWIYANIPDGAQLYTEHWNDGLPIDLPVNKHFNRQNLDVYDEDTISKQLYYAAKLAHGDYIILSTRRIWGTMPNLTEKYPLTSLVYQKLLSGELGYTEVATFTSYPQLFGWEINDDSAEESVQVFDHPIVRIFQNTETLTPDEYLEILPL